jgi:hypothetical protein
MADNRKIRIVQSLNCGDECQGHEHAQEAFPGLGALKWGEKTAEFQPPLEGKESEESTAAKIQAYFVHPHFAESVVDWSDHDCMCGGNISLGCSSRRCSNIASSGEDLSGCTLLERTLCCEDGSDVDTDDMMPFGSVN